MYSCASIPWRCLAPLCKSCGEWLRVRKNVFFLGNIVSKHLVKICSIVRQTMVWMSDFDEYLLDECETFYWILLSFLNAFTHILRKTMIKRRFYSNLSVIELEVGYFKLFINYSCHNTTHFDKYYKKHTHFYLHATSSHSLRQAKQNPSELEQCHVLRFSIINAQKLNLQQNRNHYKWNLLGWE